MDFFDDLKRDMASKHKSLDQFTLIKDMPDESPWTSIKRFYNSNSAIDKLTATFLNGVASCKKKRFLLSKKLLEKMLKDDPNSTRETINGTEFKQFIARACEAGLIQQLEEPSEFGTREEQRKAGTYEIIYPQVIASINFPDDIEKNSSLCSSHESEYETDYDYAAESENEAANEASESIPRRIIKPSASSYRGFGLNRRRDSQVKYLENRISDLELSLRLRADFHKKEELIKLRGELKKLTAH